jgi:hypothetical protein
VHGLGGCGHHREAAARTGFAGQIDVERHRIDPLQALSDRQLAAEDVAHRGTRVVAIAPVALDEQLALVAERPIEARPVHAGGGTEVVQRRRRETILAKQIERLAERDIRLIGARPAAALGRHGSIDLHHGRPFTFLYHFAINSLTKLILCGTV